MLLGVHSSYSLWREEDVGSWWYRICHSWPWSLCAWCVGVNKHMLEAASYPPSSFIKRAPIKVQEGWYVGPALQYTWQTNFSRSLTWVGSFPLANWFWIRPSPISLKQSIAEWSSLTSSWYQQTSLPCRLQWSGTIRSDLDTCVFQSLGLAE